LKCESANKYRVIEKNAGILKTCHSKIFKYIEMIKLLKRGERKNVSFGYAQLMVGSERG
jgi:hypothetical protein